MMQKLNRSEKLYVITSFSIQVILLIYFAVRRFAFDAALSTGWLIYALALPALVVSLVLLRRKEPWYLWLGGFLFSAWAIFGFIVDIIRPVEWRSPIYWPVFVPYILLYLSSLMFYWWPLARLQRSYWYVYAALFVISSYLNTTSHTW